MLSTQHFKIGAEQIRLAVLACLPGYQHGIVHRQQSQQVVAHLALLCTGERQTQGGAHRIVEPLPGIRGGRQMRSIATQQQHCIKAAPACCGQMREQHGTVHRDVTIGIQIELLRQPAPPLSKTAYGRIGLQLFPPQQEQLHQLLPRRILSPALYDAEYLQALIQGVQPVNKRHSLCRQGPCRLPQARQWLYQPGCISFGNSDKVLQMRDHAVFTHQLLELVGGLFALRLIVSKKIR